MPLNRQEDRYQREGFDISRSTLCDWAMEVAGPLGVVAKHLALEVRSGTWLRADATGMPVMDPGKTKGQAHHGHLWAWGNYDTVIFDYTADKTGETVQSIFDGFAGTILIDGASDFNLLEQTEGIVRAGCWAHARRRLYEALSYDRALALTGLALVRQLFLAERVVNPLPQSAFGSAKDIGGGAVTRVARSGPWCPGKATFSWRSWIPMNSAGIFSIRQLSSKPTVTARRAAPARARALFDALFSNDHPKMVHLRDVSSHGHATIGARFPSAILGSLLASVGVLAAGGRRRLVHVVSTRWRSFRRVRQRHPIRVDDALRRVADDLPAEKLHLVLKACQGRFRSLGPLA